VGSDRPISLIDRNSERRPRAAELFAGVGGFRLGLESAGWNVVWSNQWEPSTRQQHASNCYVARFGPEGHSNEDIAKVLDLTDDGSYRIPEHELLVGGFPCQDYSVARTLNQAAGLEGKKGVLWWQIHRLVERMRPPLIFLENVDRLLKSPAEQRGRDFAIMLTCLSDLGYLVEWRVVNAADYGFPQRRRRVLIVAHHLDSLRRSVPQPLVWMNQDGVLARSLPAEDTRANAVLPLHGDFTIRGDLPAISQSFGKGSKSSAFLNSGVMWERTVWTSELKPVHRGRRRLLADVLQREDEIPAPFFIPGEQLGSWKYLKGAKREGRVHRASGGTYFYAEGAIPFPDPIDRPSRTILTGEGGTSPSRFKHVVRTPGGRYRRLTVVELERLNGFPDGWTDIGISDARRAFLMGNALVVGLIKRVGEALFEELSPSLVERDRASVGSKS
jgi:DNA (cytosine-5)-methyltransferase 1